MSGASLQPVLWSTRNNVNDLLIQAKLLFPLANISLWLKSHGIFRNKSYVIQRYCSSMLIHVWVMVLNHRICYTLDHKLLWSHCSVALIVLKKSYNRDLTQYISSLINLFNSVSFLSPSSPNLKFVYS